MFEHYTQFAKSIGSGILALGMLISSALGVVPAQQTPLLQGTSLTPDVVALYEDSLASRITSSATSFTLARGTDKVGTALASSTYAFIIDEGLSTEEFVAGDCTATACTNLTRGISPVTGTTTVAALQFEHGRGASVKITDAPSLIFAINVLKGRQNIENPIKYNSETSLPTTTIAASRQNLVSVGLLNDTAFNGAGVISANSRSKGVVELATGLEQASSTANGSSGPLVIAAANATSSCASAVTAPLKALITDNAGKLASNCLPSGIPTASGNNTWTGANAFSTSTANSATTTIGAFPAWEIGKQQITLLSGSGNFTVPSGITKINVTVCAGGGAGGGASSSGANGSGAGGGGAGGCAIKMFDTSATTSIAYSVGAAGAASTFGTIFTTGGSTAASAGAGGTVTVGGAGGTASGGDLNIPGAAGGGGMGGLSGGGVGGSGASCPFGGGGGGGILNGGTGSAAGFCAGGGGGAATSGGGGGSAGNGTPGFIRIIW